MYRENFLKKKLEAGERCLGCWLFMGSPVITELLSLSGFDALIIDHEHAPGSLETAIHQMRAASSTPTTMLVRVAANKPLYFRHMLDAGVEGVIVANMESASQAESAVKYSTYQPDGKRGIQFGSRAADWGYSSWEYYRTIQKNLLIIGLIESVRGVEALPEICKIEGIHMLFIGAVDLAASINSLEDRNSPELNELINEIENRTLESGKWLGRVASTSEETLKFWNRGYHFVTNATDISLLREGAEKAVSIKKKHKNDRCEPIQHASKMQGTKK